MAAAALRELAGTPPKSYFDQNVRGETVLSDLFTRLVSSNLLSAGTDDDITRLHGLFDVAVAHGMGRLVIDYITEVCSATAGGSTPSSSSTAAAFAHLTHPDCVRQWLRQSLASVHQQLTFMLTQGLSSMAASCALSPVVGKLNHLSLAASALEHHSAFSTAPGRRALPSGIEDELVQESRRLLQCARVLEWLGHQKMRQKAPSGRFASHDAWRGTVVKRRAGAGSTPLFLDDMLEEVAQHETNPPSYPPPSPESLISSLFLQGSPSPAALQPKLALLSYCLVDGNFLTAPEVAETLHKAFAIPPATTLGWMLLLFLDDAQLVPSGSTAVNSSLIQAINCVPGVDGGALPYRALRVFLEKGAPEVALGLLRQRSSGSKNNNKIAGGAGNGLKEACMALQVRLANGCLIEAFLEMKRYLRAAPDVLKAQHAQQLMAELFSWGAHSEGLHGIVRLPLAPGPEENALVSYLEESSASVPAAGLMLPLFFLLRGRTPEALLAFAKHGRRSTGSGSPELEAARAQLQELLSASARMMPDAQKALIVGVGAGFEPSLRTSGGAGGNLQSGGGGGVALATAVPGIDTGRFPSMVSLGPSVAQAPLVGGVNCLAVDQQQRYSAGGATVAGGVTVGVSGGALKAGKSAAAPLLFGEPVAAKSVGIEQGLFGQFGSAAGGRGGGGIGGRQFQGGGHELDRLLGLGGQRAPPTIKRGLN